jgi:hypothetical protein
MKPGALLVKQRSGQGYFAFVFQLFGIALSLS